MITTPTLLVDEAKCRTNIEKMAAKAGRLELQFRPHFKTHQSHQIANWYRDAGVTKIACSSFGMASHFAEDGWDDIMVAFPVNVLEIDMINDLASRITLNILVESEEAVEIIANKLNHPINGFIKLDVGTRRTGLKPSDTSRIASLIDRIQASEKISFAGFLAHAGHSYGCRGEQEILDVHADCMQQLTELKSHFPDAFISFGDTPTCSIADSFKPVDELRPGNFCFYDLMQHQIGSCSQEEIAVAMASPVVAKHPERNEVVVYGGGVHFSKDAIMEDDQKLFGRLVVDQGDGWGDINPEVRLVRVSQEHGILHAPTEWIENTKIGDVVKILPIHSCLAMDLLRDFQVV